jgi:HEAT repeat protein
MFQGSFAAASLALFLALGAGFAPARAAGERLEPRPVVSGLVEELQQELARKAADPAHAKQLVERLAAEFAVSGTKDRSPIVRVLERCLAAKQQGKPDGELVCHAARALAGMAPESLPVLVRALDNKPLLKEKEIGRTLVLALGKTRDKSAVKPLLGLLDSPDDGLVAAAGEALGEFEGAALATRKQLFEEALKALLQAKDQKDAQTQQTLDPNAPHDDAAARRYDAIQAAFGTTLQRLSKQEARNADLWQRWWNKNKRADWDDKSKLS